MLPPCVPRYPHVVGNCEDFNIDASRRHCPLTPGLGAGDFQIRVFAHNQGRNNVGTRNIEYCR